MFEQLVVGGKVELFKKSRRIKENEETKEMLAGAVCAVYGISDFHEGDVASFLEALADEYRKEERSPHSPLVN